MSWPSAFASWGWADIVATVLVVIGVAGEIWSFFMKIPFNPTGFSRLESKKKKVEKWSLIILLIGVFIEVPATVENLKDAANSRLKASQLEVQLSEVTAKLKSRMLTAEQIFALEKALQGIPRGRIFISHENDPGAKLLADFLGPLFVEYGFNASVVNGVIIKSPQKRDGVSLGYSSTEPAFGESIENAFRVAKVPVASERHPSYDAMTVEIMITERP